MTKQKGPGGASGPGPHGRPAPARRARRPALRDRSAQPGDRRLDERADVERAHLVAAQRVLVQHREQQRRDQLQRDHAGVASDQLAARLMSLDADLDAAQRRLEQVLQIRGPEHRRAHAGLQAERVHLRQGAVLEADADQVERPAERARDVFLQRVRRDQQQVARALLMTVLEVRGHQRLAVGEVVPQRRRADPRRLRQLAQARAGAVAREQPPARLLEQADARRLEVRVAAAGCAAHGFL